VTTSDKAHVTDVPERSVSQFGRVPCM